MRETVQDMMQSVTGAIKPRLVANNTIRYVNAEGRTVWRLHQTDIVTHDPVTDIYTLHSGGWKTPTTKDRINAYSPARVWANKGQWFVGGGWQATEDAVPFFDGIRVDGNGRPIDAPS
jgi:hypothetical protein